MKEGQDDLKNDKYDKKTRRPGLCEVLSGVIERIDEEAAIRDIKNTRVVMEAAMSADDTLTLA